jgi:hypothetical protein
MDTLNIVESSPEFKSEINPAVEVPSYLRPYRVMRRHLVLYCPSCKKSFNGSGVRSWPGCPRCHTPAVRR